MEPPTQAEKKVIADRFLSDDAAKEPGRYAMFFRYYEMLFKGSSGDYVVNVAKPAYSSHREVVSFFDSLIRDASQSKANFSGLFAADVSTEAREHAVRVLLQASIMIDCASKQYLPEGRKVGDFVPRCWGEQQPFAKFVKRCFPPPVQSRKVRQESQSALAQRRRLKAWKLKERYRVRLRPTDNLAEHLVYDSGRGILHVFRQVGFLKAHLYRSRDEDVDMGFRESLEKGTLPPQLLLEVLDSIQYLLFPNDKRSIKSLDRFIDKYDFDPQAKLHESRVRQLPEDFEYKYLGDRLVTLLNIVKNPPAANRIVAWFDRHARDRNTLAIAALGLFLTALFGFLSLIAGIVSAVYGVKQYRIAVQALQAPQASQTSQIPSLAQL